MILVFIAVFFLFISDAKAEVKYLPLWLKWCQEVDIINGGLPWFTIKADDLSELQIDWQHQAKQREIIKTSKIIGWHSTNRLSEATTTNAAGAIVTAAAGALFFPPAVLFAPLGMSTNSRTQNIIHQKIVYVDSNEEVRELLFIPTEPSKMSAYLENSTGLLAGDLSNQERIGRLLIGPIRTYTEKIKEFSRSRISHKKNKPWCPILISEEDPRRAIEASRLLHQINVMYKYIGAEPKTLNQIVISQDTKDHAWQEYSKEHGYLTKLPKATIEKMRLCQD